VAPELTLSSGRPIPRRDSDRGAGHPVGGALRAATLTSSWLAYGRDRRLSHTPVDHCRAISRQRIRSNRLATLTPYE